MATVFKQQVIIKASPENVFQVLTDFASYKNWNPWIIEANGVAELGEEVGVATKMYGLPASFNHKVIALEPFKHFAWCDLGFFTHFAYGERHRFLQALPDGGCEYRVELRITGFANKLTALLFGPFMRQGLYQEALALRQYCEAPA